MGGVQSSFEEYEQNTPLRISTKKALVPQPEGAGSIVSKAFSADEPLMLELGDIPKHWESALSRGEAITVTFRCSLGGTMLKMTRNHWPRQVVRQFTNYPPRHDLQTQTPAFVSFTDDAGATVAELHNDTSSSTASYHVGGGRSVLYAAKDQANVEDSPRDAVTGGDCDRGGDCERTCRFCLMDEEEDQKLLWPCACSTPVHPSCLARWQRQQAAACKEEGCTPRCEVCRTEWSALPGLSIQSRDGRELHAVAEIRPVITKSEAESRGFFYIASGGVGLFRAMEPGAFASTPELVFDPLSGTVLNAKREKVAWCAPNHGATPATKRAVMAEGVDALLVLALTSEKDANIWGGGKHAWI